MALPNPWDVFNKAIKTAPTKPRPISVNGTEDTRGLNPVSTSKYGPVGPNSFMSGAGVPLNPAVVPTAAGAKPVAAPAPAKPTTSSGTTNRSGSGSSGPSTQMSAPVEPPPPPPDPWATLQSDYEGYIKGAYQNTADAIAARANSQNDEWTRLRARLDSDYNTTAGQMQQASDARNASQTALANRLGINPDALALDPEIQQWSQQDERLKALNSVLKTGSLGSLDVLNQARKNSMEQYIPMLQGTEAAQIASFAAAINAAKVQAEQAALSARLGGGGGGRRRGGGGGGSGSGLWTNTLTDTLQSILGSSSEDETTAQNTAMWNAFMSTLNPEEQGALNRLRARTTSERSLSNVAQEARDTYKPLSGNELNRALASPSRNADARQQQARSGEYFAAGKYLPAAPYLESWYGMPKQTTTTKSTGSNKATSTSSSKQTTKSKTKAT